MTAAALSPYRIHKGDKRSTVPFTAVTGPAAAGDAGALDNYLRKLRPLDLTGWAEPKLDNRLRDHRWREAVSPLRRVAHCNRHPISRGKAGGHSLSSVRLVVRPLEAGGAAARFAGLQRCGSVWSCPECARHLAAARVELITRAIATAHAKGYGACWQTLTLPHEAPDRLADTLSLVTRAWRTISASRRWKEIRQTLGVVGLFRKVEVTHGVNGWHPHAHVTFITRRPLEDYELEALEAFIWEAWGDVVAAAGFFPPYRDFCPLEALNLDQAGAGWAEYVGKMLGLEFAGTGKKAGAGRTPFEILDSAVRLAKELEGNPRAIREAGDPRLGPYANPSPRLWGEYQRATRGKHQMHWSRGLKAELGVMGEDQGDQLELADALLSEQEETVCSLTPFEWHAVAAEPARLAALVAVAELPAPLADRRREVRRWLSHWTGEPVAAFLPV